MAEFLRVGDTISGQEGKAQAIIDGRVEELFMLRSLEATATKNKEEVKTIGRRGIQQKAAGWTGEGKMSIYYVTSIFRKMIMEYIKTGRDLYFTIIATNEDPTSSVGRQTVALYNCNINSVMLTSLDVESTSLSEDLDFTFDDADILEAFSPPSNM